MNILSLFGASVVIIVSGLLLNGLAGRARAAIADSHRAGVRANCEPDGVLITSEDRLRLTVMSLDRTVRTGRAIDGSKTDLLRATAAADAFARQQAAPEVALAMLGQCDEHLLHDYAVGYWLVAGALVREAKIRRANDVQRVHGT